MDLNEYKVRFSKLVSLEVLGLSNIKGIELLYYGDPDWDPEPQ